MGKKIILDSMKGWTIKINNEIKAYYDPNIIVTTEFLDKLRKLPYTRVFYKSRFGKANRTPRETWCFGKVNSDIVSYRGLNFEAEEMPRWIQEMANLCRLAVLKIKGFDPKYNSCIIGKYTGGNDQIAFHFDTEPFLKHHCCVNITIGEPRDFQFRVDKQTYEIKLQNKSFFMFEGLEHALPKRTKTPENAVRYSISFRNMANDIGIGNSYYYCRGMDGAINDENKQKYISELKELQK